jgi:hypothetical protein
VDHHSFRDQLAFSIGFAVSRSRDLLRSACQGARARCARQQLAERVVQLVIDDLERCSGGGRLQRLLLGVAARRHRELLSRRERRSKCPDAPILAGAQGHCASGLPSTGLPGRWFRVFAPRSIATAAVSPRDPPAMLGEEYSSSAAARSGAILTTAKRLWVGC